MDWFLVAEKEGNILTWKSHILVRLEVHDKAAYNKQTCNREPNDDAEFLWFEYIVDLFHVKHPIAQRSHNQNRISKQ